MTLIRLAEGYLLRVNTTHRAILIFILVMGLSLLLDDIQMTDSVLTNKQNPLNSLLVKWGWGWTFTSVGLFLLSSSLVVHGAVFTFHNLKNILYLLVGTVVWFVFAQLLFPYVEHRTGVCQLSEITDKRSCAKAGYWWTGFDSSGHCFLLLWNILFIAEEVQVFNSIKQIRETGQKNLLSKKDGSGDKSKSTDLQERVEKWFYLLEYQLLIISLLTVVWEIMILVTAVHFHTTAEKLAGSLCGLLSWFLVYRVLHCQGWRNLEIEKLKNQ